MAGKIKLYNTLTRKKENFKEIKKGKVSMYTCGPTVYDYCHIGNFRAYIVSDILKRILSYNGFQVKQIMNITNVDDKTIKKSQEKNLELGKFTENYERAFFQDIERLNILQADLYPKATEHISAMVELVKKLLKKGYAYKTMDGIYFNIKKFKKYGKLSHLKLKDLKEGARINVDEYEKKQAKDFVLWKFYQESDGNVFWENELGKGRPGWHIECSAMSMAYLGEHFDIHTGGLDLIFPHHENEIAQSEAATGKKFVNYWVHNEWLLVDGKKMSKSLGNFYTLRDILNKGYEPRAVRYLLMSKHYKQILDFTFKNLDSSKNAVERMKNKILEIKGNLGRREIDECKIKDYKEKFLKFINDDLNIPRALALFWKILRDEKLGNNEKYALILEFDKVFGLSLDNIKEISEIPQEIKKLLDERKKARENKNFKLGDEIREKIKAKGWQVDDTSQGQKIKKI